MPFQKGNTLGRKGTQVREQKKRDLWNFIASGGRDAYNEKLEKLQNGEKLTAPEKEFMDRVERLFPYVKSKAATDMNVQGDFNISWT